MSEIVKALTSQVKTISFEPTIISVNRNVISVEIDGDIETFEDEVWIKKDPTDRDFYIFTENLRNIDSVDCKFFLDTDYNLVSTVEDTGHLEITFEDFSPELNDKDYFEFFQRGNVVDLHITCLDNMRVKDELMVIETIPMLLNGGHFFYMSLFVIMPLVIFILAMQRDCINRWCCDAEDRIDGAE